MSGIDADGWLAVHHIEHAERIEQARQPLRRFTLFRGRPPASAAVPIAAAVPVSAAPVCC